MGVGEELTLSRGCRSAIALRGHGHSFHPCLADLAIPHSYLLHIHSHTLLLFLLLLLHLHLHLPPALPPDYYTPPSADFHTHYRYSTMKTASSPPKQHTQSAAVMKGQVVNSAVVDVQKVEEEEEDWLEAFVSRWKRLRMTRVGSWCCCGWCRCSLQRGSFGDREWSG